MSELVRSQRCRPSDNRSRRWITLTMIIAMFGFAGLVFADSSTTHGIAKIAKPIALADDDPTNPSGDSAPATGSLTIVAAPSNDTCAAPDTLTLNRVTKVDTTGAANDYQSPATAACFAGIGQIPTTSPGRDVVLSFTAPAAGSYTFSIVIQDPRSDILNQNSVLYVSDSCPAGGEVNCLGASNRVSTRAFVSAVGNGSNNQSEQVSCLPMAAGQTFYVFYDDFSATNNGAGLTAVEVRNCNTETEPNNTPETANPMSCGIQGSTDVAPLAHCYLGSRAGNVCTRSIPLDQSLPESNRHCGDINGASCLVDAATGTDNCAPGTGPCRQFADLDCDPHCEGGPNDGLSCTTNAFCNPGSNQNARCAGTCQVEASCIVTATGADTGTPCTPICVGGVFAGQYCSALSNCDGGGGVCTTSAMCAAGQTCGRQFNEGDADFFALGSVASGRKIFAGMDAKAGNDMDWRMRVTTSTSTLQFDDDDGVSRNGSLAPEIAGAPGTGVDAFLKVSMTSPRQSEPYLLYSIVQGTYPAQAQLEDESGPVGNDIYFGWPGDVLSANYVNNTVGGNHGYVRGLFNGTHGGFAFDSDCFKFLVNEGDLMSWYGDGEPARIAAANTQFPQPIIYDAEPAGISNFIFGANARKNTLTVNNTLNGLSPAVTSSFFQWRAAYTGMLEVCYYDAAVPLGLGTPGNGNWAGSLDVNCGPLQPAGPGTTTTDVSVEKTILEGDGQTGTFITYQITVTNSSSDMAQEVHFQDVLDPNLSFISLTVDDGLGGNNTTCITTDGFQFLNGLPTPGTADVPVDCINTSMTPGQVTTYFLTVQVNNCIGAGIDIANTATIFTVSTDPDPSNDSSTVSFTTSEDGSCQALACDTSTCVVDLCLENGTCNAGVCESTVVDCNDNSVCTEDSCAPETGCVNDSSQLGDLCDDFVDCTANTCDPVLFCQFPPVPPGVGCSDGLNCTSADSCDGAGNCVGTSVCDDGNDCTDDFADEGNACACSYAPSFPGTPCDDGNACTGTAGTPDSCDGANACVGGQIVACDDGNACTSDSCDPALGCVYTPITCDDGDACTVGDSCDPASGCVAGTPVVCGPPDQCHAAGVCNPGSGLCGYANLPDGTTCDDGNASTSGDSCQGGVCTGSSCTSSNDPKSKGWYRSLCVSGGHSGDAITDADAACVGALTDTFAGFTTAAQVCDVLDPSHGNNGTCSKAEDWFMALALNICKQRVCPSNTLDSGCSSSGSVAQSLAEADALLANAGRTNAQCDQAECLSKEIDTGHALDFDTLSTLREAGSIRLNWNVPYTDDGQTQPRSYKIYRRAIGSLAPFVQIGSTTGTTYLDLTAGTGNWQYDVTSVF